MGQEQFESAVPSTRMSRIIRPLQQFMDKESSGGFILMGCLGVAMLWANIPAIAPSYESFWNTEIHINIGGFEPRIHNLHHLINDALMAVFFFFVGLEIKAELVNGHLSSFRRAALPVIAAAGGMAVPAIIFLVFVMGEIPSAPKDGAAEGWGIPMATDIAFAMGIMALLGSRVSTGLKVFLVAVAIVDDLGAVLVIAIGYPSSEGINFAMLGIGLAGLAVSLFLNLLGVRKTIVYILLGVGIWLCFLESGVHATVAGVLLAFTIPAKTILNTRQFAQKQQALVNDFCEAGELGANARLNDFQQGVVYNMEQNCERIQAPVERIKETLLPWVSFFIMPVFALANAGVTISGDFLSIMTDPVSLGIIFGLFIGKQIGVWLASWIAVKLRLGELPSGTTWGQIYGVSILAGIGFTMSLFIAGLAYPPGADHAANESLEHAKVGILLGSLLSGIVGYVFLRSTNKKKPDGE